MTLAVLEVAGVSKDYRGLRPLRIHALTVDAAEQVAILGLDQVTAEVFINLVTGATLPDAGEIRVFGRPTADICDSADWLATVDRFGIVSERAVLLDQLTVIQNLAMPFTLDIEPQAAAVRARAEILAQEVGLPAGTWDTPIARLDATSRVRLRLGRALALEPGVLLIAHVSAGLPRDAVSGLGREIRGIAERRGAAIVAATADETFGAAVAARVLALDAATGRLTPRSRRGWFRGRLG